MLNTSRTFPGIHHVSTRVQTCVNLVKNLFIPKPSFIGTLSIIVRFYLIQVKNMNDLFWQAIESGKLIDAEVSNYKDAVLLLWFLHNKANYRLSGDISEDPVFPKQTFPSKEFCSSCYDNTVRGMYSICIYLLVIFCKKLHSVGTNLWVEFNRGEVFQFLKNLYSRERLSSQVVILLSIEIICLFTLWCLQGLSESSAGEEHGVAIVPQVEENVDTLESLDMSNYKKVSKKFLCYSYV